jgi:DNA polymerase-1
LGLLSGKSRTLGKVDHAIACFESDRNFRRLIYPDYKANRGESDSHEREEIYEQLDMTPDLCKAFGVACVSVRYFEADDVIATLATKLSKKGFHPIIVSTDKDLAQLSQLPNCKVYHPYNDR